MNKQPIYQQWYKALRKYRNLQARLSQAEGPALIKRLSQKLERLRNRIFRLNRRFKLGIAVATLTVWMAGPVQGQIFPANFFPSILNGTNGFTIQGRSDESYAGISVDNAGDVNGDGIDDMIIGANYAYVTGRYNAGESYVVFGNSSGFSANVDLATLNGSNGFSMRGEIDDAFTGRSVSSAGDLNGDGIDDLIIGAPYAQNSMGIYTGAAYVVFGRSSGFGASIDLGALDGTNGFKIEGIEEDSYTGTSVNGGGDINGDGIDDVIIGAPYAYNGGVYTGEAYVVFGKNSAFSANLDLSTLNGTNGFAIRGVSDDDYAGFSVDFAGDINGDGIDDAIIGAPSREVGAKYDVGSAYVVFGRNTGFGGSISLSGLNGTNGFTINGFDEYGYAGMSVASAGDINGDGIDDLIIGAPRADPFGSTEYEGESYVLFGNAGGFGSTFDLASLNGTNGFAVQNANNVYGLMGFSARGIGDLNGDGIDDLGIGSPITAVDGNDYAGEAHVIFGQNSFASPFSLPSLTGGNGFTLKGSNGDNYLGASVAGGDFNMDGFQDVIIGAPGADSPNSTMLEEGEVYVIFGRPRHGVAIFPELATLPVQVFPNPSAGIVEIQSAAFGPATRPTLNLFDAGGRRLLIHLTQHTTDRYQIDISDLPVGIYHLQVIADGKMMTQKIVKK